MELSSRVAQLGMLGGESMSRTPNAGIFEYKSPWGTGKLYVFAESKGPNSEFVSRLVIETIGQEFKSSNRSLTASLTSAVREAHNVMLDENRRSLREHHASVGVTCAVVREGELFLAQCGPAVAYAMLDGQIMRIPEARSRDLPSWSTPLGSGDFLEITFSQHSVRPGDVILFASTTLATKPVEEELPEVLKLEPEEIMRHLEQSLSGVPLFSALAVRFGVSSKATEQDVVAEPKAPEPDRGRPLTSTIFPAAGAVVAALSKVRLPSVNPRQVGGALRTLRPAGGNGNGNGGSPAKSRGRSSGRQRNNVALLTRELPESASPVKVIKEERADYIWSKAEGTVEDRRKSVVPPRQRIWARILRLALLLVMTLLVALIVYSLITYFSRFSDKQGEADFDRSLNAATLTRERAGSAGDLATSRSLLNDADHLVDEALAVKKTDPKAKALKQKIAADLVKMNAVVKLPEAKVLTDLAKVEGGAKNLSNLSVAGEDIFILDRGTSRVYQFGVDLASGTLKVGKSTLVAKKGDKVGDTTVTDLVSILWMDAGTARQSSNLLLFDSSRNLFEYTPGKGLAQLKVRGAQSWINPALALGYSSNLYILDPSASQVWRYFPTFNGYDSEMRGLLENADIRDAIDFAVDKDVFVLTRSGKVQKFVGGRIENFDQDQLDKGLSNPTAIFTTPNTQYVYVVDSGNNRVVVFTKEGRFQRQLVGEALDDSPHNIHVDEERGKIYILGDNKLYLSSLPK